MKKILMTLVGALLLTVSATAQDWAQQNYGVRAGFNIANVAMDNVSSDGKLGIHLGGFYEYKIMADAPLYLEGALSFTQKGFKIKALDSSIKSTLWYLEIPVSLNYKFALNDMVIAPFGGLYYAIGIGGKTEISQEGISGKGDSFGDANFSRSDFGLRIGCMLDWKQYQFGLGYSRGLTDFAPNNLPDTKNSVWTITVGYRF